MTDFIPLHWSAVGNLDVTKLCCLPLLVIMAYYATFRTQTERVKGRSGSPTRYLRLHCTNMIEIFMIPLLHITESCDEIEI
jgi:hypothetical protein